MEYPELRCENCNRWLRVEAKGTVVAIITCENSKCKHPNNIKIINNDQTADMCYKFEKEESNE